MPLNIDLLKHALYNHTMGQLDVAPLFVQNKKLQGPKQNQNFMIKFKEHEFNKLVIQLLTPMTSRIYPHIPKTKNLHYR